MTFGEHLGELRSCLLKSIYGLVVGFVVGLTVGGYVVSFIQRPLLQALTKYYQNESIHRVESELAKLSGRQPESPQVKPSVSGGLSQFPSDENGTVPLHHAQVKPSEGSVSQSSGQPIKPSDKATTPETDEKRQDRLREQIKDRVLKENLLVDEVYLDTAELLQSLQTAYPDTFKDVRLPEAAQPKTEQSIKSGGVTAGGTATNKIAGDAAPKKLVRLFLWHRSADDTRLQSKGLSVFEGFAVYVKASLLVGVLLACPWIFYQIWQFVAAGLYPHERRYVHLYLPFSIALFLFGAALAFFVVFGPVLEFLLGFNRRMDIGLEPRINEWLSFVWILPVGFGVGFQLPLVMLFLERIGVCTVKHYLSQWRVAVLVIVVIAGVLMPPDPYSMLLNAGSLMVLYFGGILLCKLMPRRASPFGEAAGG